jgi:hypothetical protein
MLCRHPAVPAARPHARRHRGARAHAHCAGTIPAVLYLISSPAVQLARASSARSPRSASPFLQLMRVVWDPVVDSSTVRSSAHFASMLLPCRCECRVSVLHLHPTCSSFADAPLDDDHRDPAVAVRANQQRAGRHEGGHRDSCPLSLLFLLVRAICAFGDMAVSSPPPWCRSARSCSIWRT